MTYNLETAQHPEKLRRVAIDPVSRIEGHGKVTLLLDEQNKIHQVRLHVVEFRGFERFIQGRPYWEVPVLVQRLCGICPVSHHLAAAKAMDMIVGARTLTPTAEKMRRLMHYGQIFQSHALHFFHLASPDLLFGFESGVAYRNLMGVVEDHPEIARQGMLMRKFGQEIIRLTTGKRVHGNGAVPGGVVKALTPAERAHLLDGIYGMISSARSAVSIAKRLHGQDPGTYNSFGVSRSNWLSLVGSRGEMDMYHGGLRARDDLGKLIFDGIDYCRYQEFIGEETKPWTYMKFPFIKTLGDKHGWYKVGSLARVQNCDYIDTPLAEIERREFVDYAGNTPMHAPLAYHWTRMIELLHALEMIKSLLQDDDIVGGDLMVGEVRRQYEGVGVIEAPRGTLFHHYRVNDDDIVTMANLIVATTHSNQAMNEAVRHVARRYLHGREVTEGLLNHIEVAIRAFDPCLSCATHALGRMPMTVELLDPAGNLVHSLSRGG